MRALRLTAVLAVLAGLLAIGSAALAAGTPAGGAVRAFGVPKGGNGTILLTGAIGDYGKVQRQNQNGTPNKNGNYVKFNLKQGTFVGNGTTLFADLNHAKGSFNTTTCSGVFGATASMPLADGAGLYAGISGSLRVTVTFAAIGSRIKSGTNKGKCNPSPNAPTVAQFSTIAASGRVSFS